MDGRCTGITAHEQALAEYKTRLSHIEDDQDKINAKLERMDTRLGCIGWLLAGTLGGVLVQLFLVIVELKK